MMNKNAAKDCPRGTANCDVLQESAEKDSAHVKRVTPLQTKMRELQNDPQYQPDAINPSRETSTSRKRSDKETKPL